VIGGLVIALSGSLVGGDSGGMDAKTTAIWSAVLILSCVPMTLSSVYKEKALGDTGEQERRNSDERKRSSAMARSFTLLLRPLPPSRRDRRHLPQLLGRLLAVPHLLPAAGAVGLRVGRESASVGSGH
jgi:hypothetical protein